MDVNTIKKDFLIFKSHPDLTYLDTTATSLKPKEVLDKMNEYYNTYGVNIHRGVYKLSYKATEAYDEAREAVAKFINADFNEIVFTRNTTESLNQICLMYSQLLNEGDEVITTELEHHSSLLPWQNLSSKFNLKYIPLNDEGRITVENFKRTITNKSKVLAITYISNVMGYVTPIEEIIKVAHENNMIVIVDAAQAISHMPIDVRKIDCDFLAFSGHKMLGPTGIGVLYGKAKILKQLKPVYYGGDMNEDVGKYHVDIKDIPFRFEAGTPMIAEAIGLRAAIDYINKIGYEDIICYENELREYTLVKLKNIKGITLYNPTTDVAVFSFNINGVHPHDAATIFDERDICLRAGYHCAQLVSKWLNCTGSLRASFYIYNDKNDVDKFIKTLEDCVEFFSQFEGM